MTLLSLRFPVCYVLVCVFILTLFHVCAWKENECGKKMFYVVWVKCWDDVWCQKYLSQVRFPVAMKPRNAVMSSVVCLCDREKKRLVVPSLAKVKTHTKVKLCLVLNKTMILFLRCFEWSVPTCVFFLGGQLNGSHDKVKAVPRWNFRGLKSLCSRFEIWFDWLGLGLVESYEKRRGRNSVGRGRLRVSIISYIWLFRPFRPCD